EGPSSPSAGCDNPFGLIPEPAMNESAAEQALSDLAARYWQFDCYETPFLAVLAGEPATDAILFRESLADYDRRYRKAAGFLDELKRAPLAQLSGQSLATYRLLEHELTTLRRNFEVNSHLRPPLFPVGPEFNTIYFANSQTIASIEAASRYVARLETIPDFL